MTDQERKVLVEAENEFARDLKRHGRAWTVRTTMWWMVGGFVCGVALGTWLVWTYG